MYRNHSSISIETQVRTTLTTEQKEPIMSRKLNQSNDYNYEVETVRLANPLTGRMSGRYAAVRRDTGEEIGYFSKYYKPIQNADFFGKAEEALDRRGLLDAAEKKVFVTDGGSKARVIYDFKRDTNKLVVPEVGDEMGMRLIAQNSFDGSLKISWALGFLRLACTNGMTTLEREMDMSARHNQKLDLSTLMADTALDKALNRFDDALDVYTRIAKVKVSQEEGLTVLNNLTKKNVLSESIRKGIAEIFNNPRRDEDGKAGELRNLYQLYNAGTEFLTSAHITDSKGNELGTYESRRFERAHSTSQKLLKAFDLAAGNETRLKGLVTPAKNETIVTTA